jgi:hypothetical protein
LDPKEKADPKDGAPATPNADGVPQRSAPPLAAQAVSNTVLESIRAEKAKLKASAGEGTPKTMLDPQAVRDALARATKEKEIRITAEIKAKASEPLKPFQAIENYKIATPCNSVWDSTDQKDRCSYCPKCQMQVYDFTGLELPEAEELIFKREDRKNAALFKRADGKFLTADCPVGVKAKHDRMMAIVGGSILAISLLALLLMLPKPVPQAGTQIPEATSQPVGNTLVQKQASGAAATAGRPSAQAPLQRSVPTRNADGGFTWSSYVNQAKTETTSATPEATTPVAPAPVSQPALVNPAQMQVAPLSVQTPASNANPEVKAAPTDSVAPAQSGSTSQVDSGSSKGSNGVQYYGR